MMSRLYSTFLIARTWPDQVTLPLPHYRNSLCKIHFILSLNSDFAVSISSSPIAPLLRSSLLRAELLWVTLTELLLHSLTHTQPGANCTTLQYAYWKAHKLYLVKSGAELFFTLDMHPSRSWKYLPPCCYKTVLSTYQYTKSSIPFLLHFFSFLLKLAGTRTQYTVRLCWWN